MASVSSKRRRTSIGNTTIEGTNSLSDLPSGILVHAATFLATPSRALFAAALMDDAQVVNQLSSAIAGDQTTLDFGDIEKELALNLSDGDINSALLCIDAVNKLKKLRITNCVFITGIGLEPLRGSAIIQQIDLSLTCDGEGPSTLDLESSISFGIVLPILDSIIERGVVQHITLPRIWREERFEDHFTEGEVHQFLIRYNQMISNRNREGSCTNCDSDLVGVEWVEIDDTQETYGLQNYICCRCMKIYCYGCSCRVVACDQCERLCCQECTTTLFCDYCDTYYCADCKDVVECSRSECNYKVCADCMEICDKCEKRWCSDCFTVQSRCPICPERLCSDCSREKGVTPATFCGTCGTDHCDSCCSFRCPRPILKQNNWLKQENDRLRTEIRHLKDENRRLLASQGM